MRRVLVLGPGGAGKTHLAKAIAEAHDLPVVHLDQHYWGEGWTAPPEAQWRSRVLELLEAPAWVMDGNYGGTLDLRIPVADTIVLLDRPPMLCVWRLIKRRVVYRGRSRDSLPEGCPERLTFEFVWWVWTYRKRRLSGVLGRLAAVANEKEVIVLRTGRDVKDFSRGLSAQREAGSLSG
jgi:adenylate kinase family enzyme